VFSFTVRLLATDATSHPSFPVASKDPAVPMEALAASEELPHHVKVIPQSGENLRYLSNVLY